MITIHSSPTNQEALPEEKKRPIIAIIGGIAPLVTHIVEKLKDIAQVIIPETNSHNHNPQEHPDLTLLFEQYTLNDSHEYEYIATETYIYPTPYRTPCTNPTAITQAHRGTQERTIRPP